MDWKNNSWADAPERLTKWLNNHKLKGNPITLEVARKGAAELLKQGLNPDEHAALNKWLTMWGSQLTRDEKSRLFRVISSSSIRSIRERDLFVAHLLLKAGLKASEACNLTAEDYKDGWLTVGKRKVPLNSGLEAKWLEYTLDKQGPLFLTKQGNVLTYKALLKTFTNYFKEAGLEHHTLISLTHTFEYELIERNVNPLIVSTLTGKKLPLDWPRTWTSNDLKAAVELLAYEVQTPYREMPYYLDNRDDLQELFWKALPDYVMATIAHRHLYFAQAAMEKTDETHRRFGAEIVHYQAVVYAVIDELRPICLKLLTALQADPESAQEIINGVLPARRKPRAILEHVVEELERQWPDEIDTTNLISRALHS